MNDNKPQAGQHLHDRQRQFVQQQGGCTCLIHHPNTPEGIASAMEMLRSGDPAISSIAAAMLSGCPTRSKEKK